MQNLTLIKSINKFFINIQIEKMGTCTECVQGEETIELRSLLEKKKNKNNISRRKPKKIKVFTYSNYQKQLSTKNTYNTFIGKKVENENNISPTSIIDLESENSHLDFLFSDEGIIKKNYLSDRDTFFKTTNNIVSNNEIGQLSNYLINKKKNYKGYKTQKILIEFDEESENKLLKETLKLPKYLKRHFEREHYVYNFFVDKNKFYKSLSEKKLIIKEKIQTNDNCIKVEEINDKEENNKKHNSLDIKCKTILVDYKKKRRLNFKIKSKTNKQRGIKPRTFRKGVKNLFYSNK